MNVSKDRHKQRTKTGYPAVLPQIGYLRLAQIIEDTTTTPPTPALIPMKRSTWWTGVKSGRYPEPVRTLGARITLWRVEDIRALIEQPSEREGMSVITLNYRNHKSGGIAVNCKSPTRMRNV